MQKLLMNCGRWHYYATSVIERLYNLAPLKILRKTPVFRTVWNSSVFVFCVRFSDESLIAGISRVNINTPYIYIQDVSRL